LGSEAGGEENEDNKREARSGVTKESTRLRAPLELL